MSPSVRNTQFGFFVSGRRGPKQWGEHVADGKQWPYGNAAVGILFGRRFKPRSGEYGGGAANDSRPTRIQTTNLRICTRLCYDCLSENF